MAYDIIEPEQNKGYDILEPEQGAGYDIIEPEQPTTRQPYGATRSFEAPPTETAVQSTTESEGMYFDPHTSIPMPGKEPPIEKAEGVQSFQEGVQQVLEAPATASTTIVESADAVIKGLGAAFGLGERLETPEGKQYLDELWDKELPDIPETSRKKLFELVQWAGENEELLEIAGLGTILFGAPISSAIKNPKAFTAALKQLPSNLKTRAVASMQALKDMPKTLARNIRTFPSDVRAALMRGGWRNLQPWELDLVRKYGAGQTKDLPPSVWRALRGAKTGPTWKITPTGPQVKVTPGTPFTVPKTNPPSPEQMSKAVSVPRTTTRAGTATKPVETVPMIGANQKVEVSVPKDLASTIKEKGLRFDGVMEGPSGEIALYNVSDPETRSTYAFRADEKFPEAIEERRKKFVPYVEPGETDTPRLTQKYARKERLPENVLDRGKAILEEFPEVTDPNKIKRLQRSVLDPLLGDYGVTTWSEIDDVTKYLRNNGVPFSVVSSDGVNLSGANKFFNNIRSEADAAIRAIWGDIYASELKKYGAILGRSQGDEFREIWPNYDVNEVYQIRADIEKQMLNKIQEMGLDRIVHTKYGIETGALGTTYGIAPGDPTAMGKSWRTADKWMDEMKRKFHLAKSQEKPYIKGKGGEPDVYGKRRGEDWDASRPEPDRGAQMARETRRGTGGRGEGPAEGVRSRAAAKETTPPEGAVEENPAISDAAIPRQQPAEELTAQSGTPNQPTAQRSQAGNVVLPTPEGWKAFAVRLTRPLSVRKPLEIIGAPESAKALENLMSRETAADEKALQLSSKLGKTLKTPDEGSDAYLLATNSYYSQDFTPEQKAKYAEAVQIHNTLVKDMEQRLKDKGILQDAWPQSAIKSRQYEIQSLQDQIDKGFKPGVQGRTVNTAKEAQQRIKELKTEIAVLEKLKYAHLPVRALVADKFEANPDGFRALLSGTFKGIKGRKTLDPYDLVESGLLQKTDLDLRRTDALYVRYVENQLAQAALRDAGIAEGMAVKGEHTSEQMKELGLTDVPEGWIELNPELFPAFKGYHWHPVYADVVASQLMALKPPRIGTGLKGSVARAGGMLDKAIAMSKMLTFNNPIIMPMYDAFQSTALTQGRALMPPNVLRSITDVIKKSDNYFKAQDAGLFSTPYKNPFSKFQDELKRTLEGSGLQQAIAFEAKRLGENPLRIFSDMYTASWNLAWTGDKMLRMGTFNWLRKKGYSIDDAARLAAEAHGAYAGVPAKTRKGLNRVLYTPTFQIAMMKWFTKQVLSSFRLPYSTVQKLKGKAKGDENAKKDFTRLLTLATAGGILGLHDWIMTDRLGWEREEFGRKYYKKMRYVDEDGNEKEEEVVSTFANPINVPLRYYYRFVKPKPGYTKPEQISKYGRYLLTPLWKVSLDFAQNRRGDGSPITNPFDSPPRQLFDGIRYAGGEIVRMWRDVLNETEDTKAAAFESLKKHGSEPFDQLLRPFTFAYKRVETHERLRRQITGAYRNLTTNLTRRPPKSKEQLDAVFDNFQSYLDDISEQIDDYEAKQLAKYTSLKGRGLEVKIETAYGEALKNQRTKERLEKTSLKSKIDQKVWEAMLQSTPELGPNDIKRFREMRDYLRKRAK